MSEILPDAKSAQTAVQSPWLDRWVDIGRPQPAPPSRAVEIAQARPPEVVEARPAITPQLVLLAVVALAIALTLALIEFLFRRTVPD